MVNILSPRLWNLCLLNIVNIVNMRTQLLITTLKLSTQLKN